VTVLEAAARLGGRARTDEHEGFRFNHGPHALYGGGAGARVLDALGVRTSGRMPSARGHRLLRGGRLERPPYDVRGRERGALRPLLGALRARPADWAGATAADWVGAVARPGAERDLLEALVRTATYTSRLGEVPAPVAIDQTRRAMWPGVRYLDGGWQRLVERLADRARATGATVRQHARVEALLDGGGGVRVAGGEELRGRVVLAGLGPAAAGRLLLTAGGTPPVTAPRPAEAACLDVALARLPRRAPRFVMGVDVPLLLTETTRAAREVAPAGGAVVQAATYLGEGEAPDRARLEHVLDLAQPGWRDVAVHVRFLPRMTIHEHLGPRVAADATGLPGVLLAGDWIGEGWLADAALASGAAAGARAAAGAPARESVAAGG
jgi:hypothetical protein